MKSALLTTLTLTLLSSCTVLEGSKPPPPAPDATPLIEACKVSCSSEQQAEIRALVNITLPDTLSDDSTPELRLSAYGGPVQWTRSSGPGDLFGPGMTWVTHPNCGPNWIVPGESCTYTGANRWLYLPPVEGVGTASSVTLEASIPGTPLSWRKTVTVNPGVLTRDQRWNLQTVNHARTIPNHCRYQPNGPQPSAPPLEWSAPLSSAALAYSYNAVWQNTPYPEFALIARRDHGYPALELQGQGSSDTAETLRDQLAVRRVQKMDPDCHDFHDPRYQHLGIGTRYTYTGPFGDNFFTWYLVGRTS